MAETTQDLGPYKGGRPFKFTNPTALKQAISSYFDSCDPHVVDRVIDGGINSQGQTIWLKRAVMTPQKPYTASGLARALGTSRQTLLDYQNPEHYSEEIPAEVRQELADTMGDAKRRVEEFAESQLFEGNANGAKFNLTNNHGWVEKINQCVLQHVVTHVESVVRPAHADWRRTAALGIAQGRPPETRWTRTTWVMPASRHGRECQMRVGS